MNKVESLQIYANNKKDKNVINITDLSKIYLDKKDILRVFNLNSRQLEVYLSRNKNIEIIKNEKQKLIEIKILDYVFKSLVRKKKD